MMEEVFIGPSRPSGPRKRPSTVSLSFLPEHNGGIPMYTWKRRLFIWVADSCFDRRLNLLIL